jgi:hypothetical protein
MKPRIHIIGGPVSGKSYAALALSARLGVPAYDLDDLFWDRSAPGYGVRWALARQLAEVTRYKPGGGEVPHAEYLRGGEARASESVTDSEDTRSRERPARRRPLRNV